MDQALNYFNHFKEVLFLYRKDGRYPIDNNLAERQVRPFTALRKAIQHYGSDAGAEMAAVYLSVVRTVNLAGQSVWRFLGYASTFPHCSMKSSEYLWPKTKRLVKDERRSKSKLRVCA